MSMEQQWIGNWHGKTEESHRKPYYRTTSVTTHPGLNLKLYSKKPVFTPRPASKGLLSQYKPLCQTSSTTKCGRGGKNYHRVQQSQHTVVQEELLLISKLHASESGERYTQNCIHTIFRAFSILNLWMWVASCNSDNELMLTPKWL
jgi:hypothetical protein